MVRMEGEAVAKDLLLASALLTLRPADTEGRGKTGSQHESGALKRQTPSSLTDDATEN